MNPETSNPTIESKKQIPKIVMGLGATMMALCLNTPTALVATELITQEVTWQDDETRIRTLDIPYNDNGDEMVVVLPGLGQKSGHDTAVALSPTLGKLGLVTYAEYPDSGFGDDRGMIKKLAQTINNTMESEDKTELSLYAHSMGGIVLLHLLPYLDTESIDRIMLDCSPLDKNDAIDKEAAKWALRFKEVPHGIISKNLVEFYNNFVRFPDPSQPIAHRVSETIRVAMGGSSPQLWLDELDLYFSTNANDYKEYWPKNAQVSYFMPKTTSNDKTVYVERAVQKWDEVFDMEMGIFTIPNSGHANPADYPKEYNQAVSAALFGSPIPNESIYTVVLNQEQKTPANIPESLALASSSN